MLSRDLGVRENVAHVLMTVRCLAGYYSYAERIRASCSGGDGNVYWGEPSRDLPELSRDLQLCVLIGWFLRHVGVFAVV